MHYVVRDTPAALAGVPIPVEVNMRTRKTLAAALLLTLGAALSAVAAEPAVTSSLDEAQKLSQERDLPILIDFYTDW